jgi:hypothetical protein
MTHQEIRKERGKHYGDIKQNHTNIANAWHSILCSYYQLDLEPLPPHIVCLMFASFKNVRAAIPFSYNPDDFLDSRNYLDFAEECDPQNRHESIFDKPGNNTVEEKPSTPWDAIVEEEMKKTKDEASTLARETD